MNKNKETKEPTTDWPIDLQPTGKDGERIDITDQKKKQILDPARMTIGVIASEQGERGNLLTGRLLRRFTPRNDIKNQLKSN